MQDPNKPIWINSGNKQITTINLEEALKDKKSPIGIYVATPVHSECSIHYTQALLKFQQECLQKNILVSFALLKSSLVTQGRNLCVSNFMEIEESYSHFLFIDSDIQFEFETIMKMIEADKELIAAPYPLKAIDWEKIKNRIKDKEVDSKTMSEMGFTWPIKVENSKEISVEKGVMEVTHAPTGCMLIKKQVFEKMIKAYPNLKIDQPTIINGKEDSKPYYYNFFDTYHEPETKRYYGEDFGFCKRWTEIGGKCYIYVTDNITHIGEYCYSGSLLKDMQQTFKKID